jgi:hypothetical protein
MADERVTRRGLLAGGVAGLLALAGCSAFGGSGTRGTPIPRLTTGTPAPTTEATTDATSAPPSTATSAPATGSPTAVSSPANDATSPSETASPSETVSTTATASTGEPSAAVETPEPTPTSPPGDFVSVEKTNVETRREDVVVGVVLKNVGEVAFSRVELRVDLFYTPVGGPRRHVDYAYAERIFEGDFAPGETVRLSPDAFESPVSEQVSARTPPERFDVGVAFRRVCKRDGGACFLPSERS